MRDDGDTDDDAERSMATQTMMPNGHIDECDDASTACNGMPGMHGMRRHAVYNADVCVGACIHMAVVYILMSDCSSGHPLRLCLRHGNIKPCGTLRHPCVCPTHVSNNPTNTDESNTYFLTRGFSAAAKYITNNETITLSIFCHIFVIFQSS